MDVKGKVLLQLFNKSKLRKGSNVSRAKIFLYCNYIKFKKLRRTLVRLPMR